MHFGRYDCFSSFLGEVLEWPNRRAWKARSSGNRARGFVTLSASFSRVFLKEDTPATLRHYPLVLPASLC